MEDKVEQEIVDAELSTAEVGSAIPEADRLFAPPTAEEANHLLRELEWDGLFKATRVAAARGNSTVYVYSLQEAAALFLDESYASSSLTTNGAFAWVNLEAFVSWVREKVEDKALADVLEEKLAETEVYNDQLEILRHVFGLRISQFAPFLEAEAEENEEEAVQK